MIYFAIKLHHLLPFMAVQQQQQTALLLTRGLAGFAVVAGADLLDQHLVVESIKRHGAVNQRVQQHAERPGVHLRSTVRPSVDDLWRGVQGAAAERLQILVTVVEVGQPKICNLQEKE